LYCVVVVDADRLLLLLLLLLVMEMSSRWQVTLTKLSRSTKQLDTVCIFSSNIYRIQN